MEISRKGKGSKIYCICPYCNKEFETTYSNIKRIQSCGCARGYLIIKKKQENAIKRNKENSIFHSDYVELFLSNGGYCLIDNKDYDKVSKYTWYKSIRGSIESRIDKKLVKIHRIIMQPKEDMVIDHINHNELDNRRCNLRICTFNENSYNKIKTTRKCNSIYKGVSKSGKKWEARIRYNNKLLILGRFDNEIQAAKEYDKAAKKYHGEFAYLNFT